MELLLITPSMLHTTDYCLIAILFFASFSQGAQSRVIDFCVWVVAYSTAVTKIAITVLQNYGACGSLYLSRELSSCLMYDHGPRTREE
jgi:hypothetical protein